MPDIYRADHVGSLLRPREVKEAKSAFLDGRLELSELRSVEDRAILAALEKQREVGMQVYTDGEFRRTGFQNDLIESVEGFVDTDTPAVVRIWQGPGDQPTEQGTRQVVGGKLRQVRGLTHDQLAFLQAHSPGPVKMTLPSPQDDCKVRRLGRGGGRWSGLGGRHRSWLAGAWTSGGETIPPGAGRSALC